MKFAVSRGSSVKYTQARLGSERRTRVPDRPNKPASLWSVAKSSVGKDLSKVSFPVNFFEPLSFLQRLTEDFEYSELLDRAAEENDTKQLAYVAAFAVSSYSSTAERVNKPFNPLLGETYECDRTDDLGWKSISEQVSHHPPLSVIHCEGKDWEVWEQFSMASKLKGKTIHVEPSGISHMLFPASNNYYTWNKVQSTIHNVIVGNLWVDQSGTMTITNHKTGCIGTIEFIPYNYFFKDEQRSIRGTIKDEQGEVKLILSGNWDSKIKLSVVLGTSGSHDKPIYKTEIPEVIWQRKPPLPDSKNFHYFSLLACQLNEMESNVAPTDSRMRPDQRLMEDGQWDEANVLKTALEEKQRIKRRTGNVYNPLWFEAKEDPYFSELVYVYKGNYWDCKQKQNWSNCPNLYDLSVQD